MSDLEKTLKRGALFLGICAAAYYSAVKLLKDDEREEKKEKQEILLPLPLRDPQKVPLSLSQLVNKQSLKDVDFEGKRVLMRTDYNVKVKKGVVVDATRVVSTLPSLNYILERKPKYIAIITHLGRPAGDFDPRDFSLEPVANLLQTYFPQVPVRFLPDCIGPAVEEALEECQQTTIFVLENLRYHMEETGVKINADRTKVKATYEQKMAFRDALSRLGEVFVFEAFGAAHRNHSSIVGIDLPIRVAGLLMEKEMSYYAQVLGQPKRPFTVILGGAKVTDKIQVIENMLNYCDEMVIGGGMAYTFKRLQGVNIGNSLFDEEGSKLVPRILEKAAQRGVKLHFPSDHIIGDQFTEKAKVGLTDDNLGIPNGWMGLDIGPASRQSFREVIQRSQTILWNGPLGVYEFGAFGSGTIAMMWEVVKATRKGCTTIIGGGDTAAASKHFYIGNRAVADQVSWVSTGGGSSLVLMEGKLLPAIGALSERGVYERPRRPLSDELLEDEDED